VHVVDVRQNEINLLVGHAVPTEGGVGSNQGLEACSRDKKS
jgi:hypothetical protein